MNLIRFPGFIVLDDRKTLQKDGKRYPSIKALVADLSFQDRKRTLHWYEARYGYDYRLDYRQRVLRDALIEPDRCGKPHGARHGGQGGAA